MVLLLIATHVMTSPHLYISIASLYFVILKPLVVTLPSREARLDYIDYMVCTPAEQDVRVKPHCLSSAISGTRKQAPLCGGRGMSGLGFIPKP
jgi:hypothetical protein